MPFLTSTTVPVAALDGGVGTVPRGPVFTAQPMVSGEFLSLKMETDFGTPVPFLVTSIPRARAWPSWPDGHPT